eukprot:TRINITY_DN5032_c1_g2_i2.p1 TRINITY_DN5032_c1_g2~~TRINITY_DN5032_c1_g2_i2.p1  ORF type:complete len:238 (-),score=44.29 TRINITY_DN5032_c1_g2_i2:80-793(-)
MDVTNEKQVTQVVNLIASESDNRLWAVINNAGIYRPALLSLSTLDDWRLTFEVNVLGIATVTKACLPLLRQTRGRVVNIASVVGMVAPPSQAAYASSKFAVEGLSDSWRRELNKEGISVVIIEPGIMNTELYTYMMTQQAKDKTWDSLSSENQQYYGREYVDDIPLTLSRIVKLVNGNPKFVVDALEQAVVSYWPLTRYTIGSDTITWWVSSIIPSDISDFLWGLIGNKKKPSGWKK